MMDDARLTSLGETIAEALQGSVRAGGVAHGVLVLETESDKIVDLARFLRDDPRCRFVNFTDVTAVDYPGPERRFHVVYHFLSPTLKARVRIKLQSNEP